VRSLNQQIPVKHITQDWRAQLGDLVTSTDELLELLHLNAKEVGLSGDAHRNFALKVPRSFVKRMQAGDPKDPLLLQVLPHIEETVKVTGYGHDPVGEIGAANPRPGVVHKYQGRVLLIASGGCAIHCRYCFRRHFPYSDNQNSRAQWHEALDYIRRDPSISEVILSGGDPLILQDQQLAELVDEISSISHIQRLRVHTRLPIVIPQRVTDGLIDAIARPELSTVMVIHANHANEIDGAVEDSIDRLRRRGILTLNQTVLLAGINDSANAQIELCEKLFAAGALPYYLHVLDKVAGAAHFDTDESLTLSLHDEMKARLPGYLLPRLVRELEGAPAKVEVASLNV
jgi:EF-P beta-lysylation protein EpmB